MKRGKTLHYANGFLGDAVSFNSSDFEIIEEGFGIHSRPRNSQDGGASKPRTVLCSNFKEHEDNDLPDVNVQKLSELAYNSQFVCNAVNYIKEAGDGPVINLINDVSAAVAVYSSGYTNLMTFTIEFRYTPKTVTGLKLIVHEYFQYSASLRGQWYIARSGTELRVGTFEEDGTYHYLETSELNLTINTEYVIRVTYQRLAQTGEVGISVDGDEKANSGSQAKIKIFDEEESPLLSIGAYPNFGASPPKRVLADLCYIGDLAVYNAILPANYTPRSVLLKPFVEEGSVVCTYDSGTPGAIWDASSIVFSDETDLNNGDIKMEWDSDNDNSPSFSGSPDTFANFKAGSDPVGRYWHVRYTAYSDGYTKRKLRAGHIDYHAEDRRIMKLIRR